MRMTMKERRLLAKALCAQYRWARENTTARTPQAAEYSPEVTAPLAKIWRILDYIAAKRLAVAQGGALPARGARRARPIWCQCWH